METSFAYPITAQYLTNCMLNVTDDCNLQCRYCFVEQHPHYMTFDIAKATIDWLHNNLIKKRKLGAIYEDMIAELTFFGGEPMLCYDSIIVPIVEYCNQIYPNDFKFSMTTNGTLLFPDRIKFLKENNVNILLSIDGDRATQEYNRPCKVNNISSFDLLEANIPALLKAFPMTTFRSTIYAPTVEHLFENYCFAESLGFRSYEAIVDRRHDELWTEDKIKALDNEYSKTYAYRLQQMFTSQPVMHWYYHDEWLHTVIRLYDGSNFFDIKNQSSVGRCGLGTTSGAVAWDGNIYGCQEQPSRDNKNIFLIGNVLDGGIDIQKHYKLLKLYYDNQIEQKIKKEECNTCEMKQVCAINYKGCPSSSFDLFGNFNSFTNIDCQMRKIYYYNSLLTMKIVFDTKNDKIISNLLKILRNEDL